MTKPTTDRERLISSEEQRKSLERELESMLKSLGRAETENIHLRAEAQRGAAFNDQRQKNILSHLFDIIKFAGAVIAGLLGIKYGLK